MFRELVWWDNLILLELVSPLKRTAVVRDDGLKRKDEGVSNQPRPSGVVQDVPVAG